MSPGATGPDALAALRVDPDTGLTQVEVVARRTLHGFNEVTERKGAVRTVAPLPSADSLHRTARTRWA